MESFGMLFLKETNTIDLAMVTNRLVNTFYQIQNNFTRGHMT
jgi:hypothetical protein